MRSQLFFLQKRYIQRTFYHSANKIGELLIARHAKSDHNEEGRCAGFDNASKLTAWGIEEARKEGELLAKSGVKIHKAYTSPLKRTEESMNIIKGHLPGIEIITVKELVERNFGAFTGMSKSKIKETLTPEAFHQYIHDKDFSPPEITLGHKYFQSEALYGTWPNNHKGESYQSVINRLKPFIKKIEEELLSGQNILIVGHSHTLQLLIMLLYKKPFEEGIEQYKLPHMTTHKFRFLVNSDNQLIVKEKIRLTESDNGNKALPNLIQNIKLN